MYVYVRLYVYVCVALQASAAQGPFPGSLMFVKPRQNKTERTNTFLLECVRNHDSNARPVRLSASGEDAIENYGLVQRKCKQNTI
jgi:hypothetical protein